MYFVTSNANLVGPTWLEMAIPFSILFHSIPLQISKHALVSVWKPNSSTLHHQANYNLEFLFIFPFPDQNLKQKLKKKKFAEMNLKSKATSNWVKERKTEI